MWLEKLKIGIVFKSHKNQNLSWVLDIRRSHFFNFLPRYAAIITIPFRADRNINDVGNDGG